MSYIYIYDISRLRVNLSCHLLNSLVYSPTQHFTGHVTVKLALCIFTWMMSGTNMGRNTAYSDGILHGFPQPPQASIAIVSSLYHHRYLHILLNPSWTIHPKHPYTCTLIILHLLPNESYLNHPNINVLPLQPLTASLNKHTSINQPRKLFVYKHLQWVKLFRSYEIM